MAPYVDPLLLLRQALMERKKVHWAEEYVEIDGHRVHRSRKCGFQQSPGTFLDIGSVFYMYKTVSGDREYTVDSTRKHGFQYISVTVRGDLCDFLVGRLSSCRGLVQEVIEGRKRIREDSDQLFPRTKNQRQSEGATSSKAKSATDRTSSGPAESGRTKADITYTDVLARARPLKDLDVLVRCPGRPVPNAELILKIAQDELKQWHQKDDLRVQEVKSKVTKIPLIAELEKMLLVNPANRPIILVPCNKRSPVNILNALKLLQDGEYTKTDEDKMAFFESTRDEFVEIVRNIGGRMWTFEVRDTIKNFTKAHWLRVVAVITDGSDWQLKGWPFETVVDLFTTIKGIYFAAVGSPVPLHVTHWAVSILHMAPMQFQHRFASLRDAFWVEVERFLQSHRHRKFVNHTTLNVTDRIVVKPKPIL